MITQGQESCLHTPVWGVEGFNISTSKEVEGELTTGKQLTRVFNGLVEENTTEDTAMTKRNGRPAQVDHGRQQRPTREVGSRWRS